ncbi:ras-related protein Rab-44 [Erinaceus europaeus]|uniref:Ras-related protein Rab-44 n=1 Tax=Erinaceus europaeus TaxID=9365 RepID=A0A1S2ZDX2_ERIEU|nr:ras-related protein Rab-44 [Erinaceus europaeus]
MQDWESLRGSNHSRGQSSMESGQIVSRKGRKLGSSRRRQTQEAADGKDAPEVPEVEAWSSLAAAELQSFFQDCGAKDRGFVTREDLAVAKFSFLGNDEAPEMLFDWVDLKRKGHLSLEEFSSGLKTIFGSSSSSHRLRRRPLSSKRGSTVATFPGLEEVDAQEKEAFSAFVAQLGTGHPLPEQSEVLQIWGKLRQEEPQLAGDLEGFMAKVTGHLQDAQADKEVLELTLKKRDSDHHHKVQQLYEEMEQQIHQEKQHLQAESDSRSLALNAQMQEVLEAKEQEVQQLAEGQRELEAQLHSLNNTHQEAQSENQQLREAERHLVGQLEEAQGQLRMTRRKLHTAKGRVSWQVEEKPSVLRAGEKALDPQAVSPVEHPLPGLFGDTDDWDQLLSRFSSLSDRALQISWSPPPSPRSPSGQQTPRVVRQISISKPRAVLFHGEPPSEPDGVPQSPPGVPSQAKKEEGGDLEWQDTHPEQPVESPSIEPQEESEADSETHFCWELPGAPTHMPGSLEADSHQVLIPLEGGPPPLINSPPPQPPAGPSGEFQASCIDDKGPWPGPVPPKPPRQREVLHQDLHIAGSEWGLGSPEARMITLGLAEGSEQGKPDPHVQEGLLGGLREAHGQIFRPEGLPTMPHQGLEEVPRAKESTGLGLRERKLVLEAFEAQGLKSGHSDLPQQDSPPVLFPSDIPWTGTEAEAPAHGKTSSSRSSVPKGAQSEGTEGPQEPTHTLPTMAELEAQLGLSATTAHSREQGPPQSKEAEDRSEDTGVYPRMAELTPASGGLSASEPVVNPDYIFHVIFLGDSNVGKTSFLHLLHQNAFATGLTATVGIDFRVKNLLVDGKCFVLQLWDTAGQERYHSMSRQLLRKADGVVLMYDVTSQESFIHVRYWLECLQDSGSDGVVILLLGNKMDCEEERQVPTETGQQLAQELGISFAECSAALGHNILEPLVGMARSLKRQEDRLKGSLVEVVPERPLKKAGCCS